jgi:ubiquinol-cytochrome c reductase cytochrome b subunit
MYVFGSATLFSFLVAVVTGIPIASIYVPSSGQAYQSLQWLDHQAILGFQLRGLHLISATAMFVLPGVPRRAALRGWAIGSCARSWSPRC